MRKTHDTENEVIYKDLSFMRCPMYRVGTDGSVWSRKTRRGRVKGSWGVGEWKRLTPYKSNSYGHLAIRLVDFSGVVKAHLLHRLILEAFVGPAKRGIQCRHLNGDPGDNRLENLAWGTAKENQADREFHGTKIRGMDFWAAKLTDADIPIIRGLYSEGWTMKRLAERYKVTPENINFIVHRRTWKHVK